MLDSRLTAPSSQPIDSANPSPLDDARSTRKVIFGSGGIHNGAQVLEMLQAGADVAQMYTALVYSGVSQITSIKKEMIEEMRSDNAKR